MLHELFITHCTGTSISKPFTFTKNSYNHETLLEARKLEKLEIQLIKSKAARLFNLTCLANKSNTKNLANQMERQYIWTGHNKDFTLIDRDSNTLHHQAKETLHICIKDPSLNRNIAKVRIPSVFNKLLKPPRQLKLPHSSMPHPRGNLLHLVFQHKGKLTLYTFLISIYNRSVIPVFTPFKLQDNAAFRSPSSQKHIGKQFSHITKCHLLQKVFKLQVLWSSHQFIKQGWRWN